MRLDVLTRRLYRFGVDVDDRDRVPVHGQPPRDRPAKLTSGAGYYRNAHPDLLLMAGSSPHFLYAP